MIEVKIRDFSLIIAALIIGSAILFDDPTRPQPLLALGYITIAIILIGNYIKSLHIEKQQPDQDKSLQLHELTTENKHILNDKE